MHPQPSRRPVSKNRAPVPLLSDPIFSGLLERDFDDEHDFEYEHGLLDNIDREQNHHSPYDLQDDAQEFYNRQINEDHSEDE